MREFITLSPLNSVLFIMDFHHGKIPDEMQGLGISSNTSCIAVGTLSEIDGETEIGFSDNQSGQTSGLLKIYEGVIETPNKNISIVSSSNQELLCVNTKQVKTALSIFANDDYEPNKIEIVLG